MAILTKGQTFSTGDQVTASRLNELVDDATFATGAVDDLTIGLDSNTPKRLKVKDSGIGSTQIAGDAVVPTKVSFVDDALAATDGHVLVADGTEFNNVAVSGDVSIDNTGAVTIADDAVTIGKIADAAIVTESEGIASNDNDTTIPTSAAVKDYVDSSAISSNIILATATNSASSDKTVDGYTLSGTGVSESSGVLTITGAGVWAVSFYCLNDPNGGSWRNECYINNSIVFQGAILSSDNVTSGMTFVNSSGSFTAKVDIDEKSGTSSTSTNVRIEAFKLT
jgi:hypothetical protein